VSTAPAPEAHYDGPDRFIPDLLHRAAASFETQFLPALRRRRLIPSAWRVLATLAQADGLAVGELALRTATDQTTLSRVIMRMEGRLLVQRRRRTQDSRFIDVFLLPQGRRMFEDLLPTAVALGDRLLAGVAPAERDALTTTLRTILAIRAGAP
jgi:DNA-binding MarR family transcriptional regulator